MERLLVASIETSTRSFGRYKQLLMLYMIKLSIKINMWKLISVKKIAIENICPYFGEHNKIRNILLTINNENMSVFC